MKKVTARENFVAIKNIVAATENAEELVAFLDKKIAEIDARAEKAKEKRAAKAAEKNDELVPAIAAVIGDEPITPDEIVAALGIEDLTRNKVTARIGKVEGIEKVDITVEVDGKKLKRTAYKKAAPEV